MSEERNGSRHLLHLRPARKTPHYLLPQGKRTFSKFVSRVRRSSRSHDSRCVFVVSDNGKRCGERSQGCHAISKANVVVPLAGNRDRVVDFTWGFEEWSRVFLPSNPGKPVSLWTEEWIEPAYPGKDEATKTGFGCNFHDRSAFGQLDGATSINVNNKALTFEVAHRALLYTNSRLRQIYGLFSYRTAKRQLLSYGLSDQVPVLKVQSEAINLAYRVIRQEVTRIGKLRYIYKDNLDSIPIEMLVWTQPFRSDLKFAATGLIDSSDTFLIVLPDAEDSELHQLTTIQFERRDGVQSQVAEELLSLASQSTDSPKGWIALFQHILLTGSCTIASIDSYERLKRPDIFLIKSALKEMTQSSWMERLFQRKRTPG